MPVTGRGPAMVGMVVACALVLGACESSRDGSPRAHKAASPPSAPGHQTPQGRRSQMRKRRATHPRRTPVRNLALTRPDRRKVGRAVGDLKALGFWRELTGHVESVIVATRPGVERIPVDGRLADSIMNVSIDRYPGYVCDIVIFSEALRNDVARQAVYYSQGRLARPPPTVREFWVVLLAHELAHCSKRGQKGEAYPTIWERRVLDALGASRVGTPSD